jgi:hypothetical protein
MEYHEILAIAAAHKLFTSYITYFRPFLELSVLGGDHQNVAETLLARIFC